MVRAVFRKGRELKTAHIAYNEQEEVEKAGSSSTLGLIHPERGSICLSFRDVKNNVSFVMAGNGQFNLPVITYCWVCATSAPVQWRKMEDRTRICNRCYMRGQKSVWTIPKLRNGTIYIKLLLPSVYCQRYRVLRAPVHGECRVCCEKTNCRFFPV